MDLKEKYKLDIENARKHKLFQDKLRFGIPAAYLAYVAGFVALMADKNNSSTVPYLVSAFIGFGVFLITIAEHNWYVYFKIEEQKFEKKFQKELDLISDDDLKNFIEKNGKPNLYQATIFIILLWISISVSGFLAYSIPFLKDSKAIIIPIILFTFLQLLVLKYWHKIHDKCLSKEESFIGKWFRTK